jgi:hypothetical protein
MLKDTDGFCNASCVEEQDRQRAEFGTGILRNPNTSAPGGRGCAKNPARDSERTVRLSRGGGILSKQPMYVAKMVRDHTISWRTPSLSLLLAACVALLSVLGRAWDWGVQKGSGMCSWEATQPMPLHDTHSLVHKSFADLSLARALEGE